MYFFNVCHFTCKENALQKGMLCMMWPVAVLGHRLQENDVISLPLKKDQTTYPHVSCNSVQKQQLKTMLEHFEEVHCKKERNATERDYIIHSH